MSEVISCIFTPKCNLNCSFCYNKFKNESIHRWNNNDIDKLANYIKNNDVSLISLIGGEPLCDFDLFKEIVVRLRKIKSDLKFVTFTNCTMLSKDKVEWLNKNNVAVNVSFSLHGEKGIIKIFQKFKQSFPNEDLRQNILSLKKVNFFVVVTENNWAEDIFALHNIFPNIKISAIYDKNKISKWAITDANNYVNEIKKLLLLDNSVSKWFCTGDFATQNKSNRTPMYCYGNGEVHFRREDKLNKEEWSYLDEGMSEEVYWYTVRLIEETLMINRKGKYTMSSNDTFYVEIMTNNNCNLRCKYCYEPKHQRVNDPEIIKKFLNIKFDEWNVKNETKRITLDFIGGETLIPITLLDDVFSFVVTKLKELNYLGRPIFCITTNGTLISNNKNVQDFIDKWKNYLSITISIDGTKECHDLNRVYIDGSGSYNDAIAGYQWLKEKAIAVNVKATFNPDTAKYYGESIISLIKLGFKDIMANTDTNSQWTEELGLVLIDGVKQAIDYIFDNGLEKQILLHKIVLLEDNNIVPFNPNSSGIIEKLCHNYCGAGNEMMCLGFDGKIYPCNRFATSDNPKHFAELKDNKIVITNPKFKCEITEMYKQFDNTECSKCNYVKSCPFCVALPRDLELTVKETINKKMQCGYTKMIIFARLYFAKRWLEKY